MTVAALKTVRHPADFRNAGLLALLASTIVIAQTADQYDLSITIDDLQRQEIFDSAGDWRKVEVVVEETWRQPPPPKVVQKSRIDVGYDSIYDDARLRRDQTETILDLELEKYKPSSAIQVKF